MRFEETIRYLVQNDNYILTAHDSPDADAIGSEVALYRALRGLGKKVRIINSDPEGIRYAFLNPRGEVEQLALARLDPGELAKSRLIILDTNDTSNIGFVARDILPLTADCLIIDHHEGINDPDFPGCYVESEASSTCEILYRLFEGMGTEVDFEAAQALYTGILFDTGCFIYPKTSAETFRIAGELVKRGVNPNHIYARLYENDSFASLKLHSRVMAGIEFFYEGAVAMLVLTREMIRECEAKYEEAETLINIPLRCRDVRVSVLLKQNPEGILRCSMRSK
ncbi:MAG: DHH family phosphoesterase, partial [Spirochaetales bacterium]|nr:DHH family phosphoesterase [Spirochaetales bacterium]